MGIVCQRVKTMRNPFFFKSGVKYSKTPAGETSTLIVSGKRDFEVLGTHSLKEMLAMREKLSNQERKQAAQK